MKTRKLGPLAAALSFLVFLGACSVKEDRKECPCFLIAVFDRAFSGRINLCGWQGTGCVFTLEGMEPNAVGEYVSRIERGVYDFSASVGYNVITPGNQCDSLYLWSSEVPVDATGEEVFLSIPMYKQFATVFLTLENPASVEVKGGVMGVELFSRKPVEGVFRYLPTSGDGRHYSFRLPRQNPGVNPELTLILNGDIDLPLGSMISASGYDWEALSLSDVELYVNYVKGNVSIKVLPWEEGFTNEVIR